MQLQRTTVRLEPILKKELEAKAFELNLTFQDIFTQALKNYLHQKNKAKAQKIVFLTQPLGKKLVNLTREELYAD